MIGANKDNFAIVMVTLCDRGMASERAQEMVERFAGFIHTRRDHKDREKTQTWYIIAPEYNVAKMEAHGRLLNRSIPVDVVRYTGSDFKIA